jgi:hypothetical protein
MHAGFFAQDLCRSPKEKLWFNPSNTLIKSSELSLSYCNKTVIKEDLLKVRRHFTQQNWLFSEIFFH